MSFQFMNLRYATAASRGILKWKYKVDVTSPPAVDQKDGTIYVHAYDDREEDNFLHALNPTDGSLKWKRSTMHTTGGKHDSSPTVDSNHGTVYVASINHSLLYSFSPDDGSLNWKYTASGPLTTSPKVDPKEGTVYVTSADNILHALNSTGSLKWKRTTIGAVNSSPTVDPDDGTIYLASLDHSLYAINAIDGVLKWKRTTGGALTSSPTLDLNRGAIYVASGDRSLYSFNLINGSLKWKHTAAGDLDSSPTVDPRDGTIYIASNNELYPMGTDGIEFGIGFLRSVHPTNGKLKWKSMIIGKVDSPAVDPTNGAIYVGSQSTFLHTFNSTDGRMEWTYKTADEVTTSPRVGLAITDTANNAIHNIYVGSDDNFLHAVTPPNYFACKVSQITTGMGYSFAFNPPVIPELDQSHSFAWLEMGQIYENSEHDAGIHGDEGVADDDDDGDHGEDENDDDEKNGIAVVDQKVCTDSFNSNFCDRNFDHLKAKFCDAYAKHPPYICSKIKRKSQFEAISLALGLAELLYIIMLLVVTKVLWLYHRRRKTDGGADDVDNDVIVDRNDHSGASTTTLHIDQIARDEIAILKGIIQQLQLTASPSATPATAEQLQLDSSATVMKVTPI